MKERFKQTVAVFLILTRYKDNKKEILLQLRQNTGYLDGYYDSAASGHLEKGETIEQTAIREAKEEIGVDIELKDLKFVAVIHKYREEYLNFFFEAEKYSNVPEIKEKEKCSELKWFDINNLPDNINPVVRNVLLYKENNIIYDDEDYQRLNLIK